MRSHLLEGVVRHRRARPVTYALEHGVYYLALDLDEMGAVDRSMRLISVSTSLVRVAPLSAALSDSNAITAISAEITSAINTSSRVKPCACFKFRFRFKFKARFIIAPVQFQGR